MTDLTDKERKDLAAAGAARSELEQTETTFDVLRETMVEAIFKTDTADAAERERLYLGVKVLDSVRHAMRMAVASGEVAKAAGLLREQLAGKQLA